MKDNYVLDSTVWVDIERKNAPTLNAVQPYLDRNEVCLVDVIVVELLRGVKTRQDYRRLQSAFSDFLQLTTSWARVANLAFRVARKGFSPPLIDLYIAQCVIENGKTLITHDKHFRQIAQVKPLRFEVLP